MSGGYNPAEPRDRMGKWTTGGSAPAAAKRETPKAILDFERIHMDPGRRDKVESLIVVDKHGYVVYENRGDLTHVDLQRTTADDDAILTHVHPSIAIDADMNIVWDPKGPCVPFSPNDGLVAIQHNYYQIRACGSSNNKPTLYTLTRPEKGWPSAYKFHEYLESALDYWRERLLDPGMAMIDFSNAVLSAAWQDTAEQFGMGYTEE